MAVLVPPSLCSRTGSTLGKRRNSRFELHNNSRSDGKPVNSCGGREAWMAIMVLLICALIVWPYAVFGPNVVFSVNISPRDEHPTKKRRSNVRGLSGHPEDDDMSTTAKDARPRIFQHASASGLLNDSASMREDLSSVGNEPPLADRGQAAKRGRVNAVPSPRDLCLGMAVGVSPAQLVTFAASFREVAPAADLVLFFEAPTSERFKDIIKTFGILSLEIDRAKLEPAALRRYSPSSARWVIMQRFLDAKGSQYKHVLMADAGQVFFQSNPFDIIGDPGIYTFMDEKTIGESEKRSADIRNCFGDSVLANLADKRALHSAISLGTLSSATDYAHQMSDGVLSPAFQACEAAGVDAGLHDRLVYSGELPGVLMFDEATGPATDVQAGKFKMSGSRVTNPSGREVPIVHRYVTNANIKRGAFRRYVYWTSEGEATGALPPSDETTTADAATPSEKRGGAAATVPEVVASCEQYTLAEGVDLFKAKCDLADATVGSLGDCCTACSGRRACQAFSYDESRGLCYMKNCNAANPHGPSAVALTITSGTKSKQIA